MFKKTKENGNKGYNLAPCDLANTPAGQEV